MTIFIYCEKKTVKDAINIISKPDDFKRQIVRVWHKSSIKHCFGNDKNFKRAVRKNRRTLESPDVIRTLFTSSNYLFSTRAEGRKETLYFEDPAAKRTGRLRQQHTKGPLAKIDKKPRTHRFLSTKKRFEFVKERMRKWKYEEGRFPRFYSCEKTAEKDKYHIEFSCEKRDWHDSGGKVMPSRNNPDCISSALENILGIRKQKSRA